jgi:hypothetical protein
MCPQVTLMLLYLVRGGLLEVLYNTLLVVCVHGFLNHMQGIEGAISQTGTQAVAEIITDNTRFTIYNSQCTFRTGGDT